MSDQRECRAWHFLKNMDSKISKTMKKLLLATILASQVGVAQDLKVGELSNITRLTHDGIKYENPQWSPDGSKIAFTEWGYNNLYVINSNGSEKKQLSNGIGVGFRYSWCADSHRILVRELKHERIGMKNKRHQAAWSIEVNGKKTRMTEDVERMDHAAWQYDALGVASVRSLDAKTVAGAKYKIAKTASVAKQIAKENVSVIVNTEGLSVIDGNGTKKLINAKPSFCPALSPNGKTIAFVEGNDIYTINIDGSNKQKITRGFNPSWVNDSQLVFEKSVDDGHTFTASDLYIVNVNGTGLKALTATSDRIEMCPSVSADGKRLVFTSFDDGQVYTADLK